LAEDTTTSSDSKGEALASLGDDLLSRLGETRASSSKIFNQKIKLPKLAPASLRSLAVLAAVAALCGTGILFVLNAEADAVEKKSYSASLAVLFILILMVYRYTQQVLISSASAAIEQALHQWRERITAKVLRLSLRDAEDLSGGKLVDGLAKHYEQLSQTIVPLISGFESGILLIFMFAYLVSLSLIAGFLTVAVALILIVGYINTSEMLKSTMTAAAKADAHMARLAEEIVQGFKELSLNSLKRTAIQQELGKVSSEVARQRSKTANVISNLITSANSASYLLAASVVFLLPILSGSSDTGISKIVTAVLFLLGPIGGVVGAAQQLATAQFTLKAIRNFEQDVTERMVAPVQERASLGAFERLALVDVDYIHKNNDETAPGFGINAINFTIDKGQIAFITGGNGSGKTTALRVLTGLYPVHGGRIEMNGLPVGANMSQSYRDLFSTVFADYHVFGKPYAISDEGMEQLELMLSEFGIREKLPLKLSDGFDPTSLSTGQRKRLALALALSESRPVLILDEWAADQDPATREIFYTQILPRLKASGKTIIAVTHDDRYFHCADIRFHMADGRLSQVTGA
jgi:putative pyoverdin transport system ATP-binding/permease protein